MIAEAQSTPHLLHTGQRVRLVDARTSEVGTVVATGTRFVEGQRVDLAQVLWPVGSEPRTQGLDGRLRRWHCTDELVALAEGLAVAW